MSPQIRMIRKRNCSFKIKTTRGCIRSVKKSCLNFILILTFSIAHAQADEFPKQSLALYGGLGSQIPMVDIVRFRRMKLEPQWILSTAYSRALWSDSQTLALELEGSFTKYMENPSNFSIASAFLLRWLNTPWSSVIPGSVALGNGLSFASEIPDIESRHLSKNSRLLYHLIFEFTWTLQDQEVTRWEALFRVHHRSGIFGIFEGVVGGSDFLCLGLRRRF